VDAGVPPNSVQCVMTHERLDLCIWRTDDPTRVLRALDDERRDGRSGAPMSTVVPFSPQPLAARTQVRWIGAGRLVLLRLTRTRPSWLPIWLLLSWSFCPWPEVAIPARRGATLPARRVGWKVRPPARTPRAPCCAGDALGSDRAVERWWLHRPFCGRWAIAAG